MLIISPAILKEGAVEEYNGSVAGIVSHINMQLPKAQEDGKDIFSYDPQLNGVKDYARQATEMLSKLY